MSKEPDPIVGNAPPRLPASSAEAIKAAAEKHGFDVPPIVQASIDADKTPATRAAKAPPAAAGDDA